MERHSTGRHKKSDYMKHINYNFHYKFRCFFVFFLSRASRNCLRRKILETYYIKATFIKYSRELWGIESVQKWCEIDILRIFSFFFFNIHKYFVYVI